MKQTAEQMILAIQAFEKDGKVEFSVDGKHWEVVDDPTWSFHHDMYRPVQTPQVLHYLCYEHTGGALCWFREDGKDHLRYADREDIYTRVPEFDREVVK